MLKISEIFILEHSNQSGNINQYKICVNLSSNFNTDSEDLKEK